MRWLLICLLVSLVALLLTAAGVARHIWLQRRDMKAKPNKISSSARESRDLVEEIDVEP